MNFNVFKLNLYVLLFSIATIVSMASDVFFTSPNSLPYAENNAKIPSELNEAVLSFYNLIKTGNFLSAKNYLADQESMSDSQAYVLVFGRREALGSGIQLRTHQVIDKRIGGIRGYVIVYTKVKVSEGSPILDEGIKKTPIVLEDRGAIIDIWAKIDEKWKLVLLDDINLEFSNH